MRILFLDDDSNRHKTFQKKMGQKHDVTYVWNVREAREKIESLPRFDVFSLDHDLGGEVFVAVSNENCGSALARYIASEEFPDSKTPDTIIIHSLNPDGAKNMESILRSAGLNATRKPFTSF